MHKMAQRRWVLTDVHSRVTATQARSRAFPSTPAGFLLPHSHRPLPSPHAGNPGCGFCHLSELSFSQNFVSRTRALLCGWFYLAGCFLRSSVVIA